ncbi:MAG: hypothetical protein LBN12_02685 [Clostridiales Family XIII bacterium]|nr:hypothetical protein [Clostridiales Family XIII bacterium]
MKKPPFVLLLLLTIFLFGACGGQGAAGIDSVASGASPHKVIVEGDVAGGFVRIENTLAGTSLDAAPGGSGFHGVTLSDFLAEASPAGAPQDVYFMSGDGFVAKVDYADADEIYVIFNDDKGFCIIAPNHPISAQAQEIDRFVVVSDDPDFGLTIVRQDGSRALLSKGQMLVSPLRTSLHFQGSSEMANGGETRSSSVYTKELSAPLGDLYADYAGEPIIVVTKSGDKYLTDGAGDIIVGEQRFDYRESTGGGETYEDIAEIQIR